MILNSAAAAWRDVVEEPDDDDREVETVNAPSSSSVKYSSGRRLGEILTQHSAMNTAVVSCSIGHELAACARLVIHALERRWSRRRRAGAKIDDGRRGHRDAVARDGERARTRAQGLLRSGLRGARVGRSRHPPARARSATDDRAGGALGRAPAARWIRTGGTACPCRRCGCRLVDGVSAASAALAIRASAAAAPRVDLARAPRPSR